MVLAEHMLVLCQQKRLCEYYRIKDIDDGNVDGFYRKLFSVLYVCEAEFSFDEISAKFSIGLSTLFRFRKRVVRLAKGLSAENHFYKYANSVG